MNSVLARMKATRWSFAGSDPASLRMIEGRIRECGRAGQLINYSDLVRGIRFHLPTINEGQPFEIDVHDWRDIDRAIVGEFLGYLSMQTYEGKGFIASALAVGKDEGRPSQRFFEWMRTIGLLTGTTQDAETEFWIREVKKAHAAYGQVG